MVGGAHDWQQAARRIAVRASAGRAQAVALPCAAQYPPAVSACCYGVERQFAQCHSTGAQAVGAPLAVLSARRAAAGHRSIFAGNFVVDWPCEKLETSFICSSFLGFGKQFKLQFAVFARLESIFMIAPVPLRDIPKTNIFRKDDVFVLFGELFGRGYANGLINEARKAGMTIIGITVGRRDENSALRPLTDEELAVAESNLGGRIINVPLMAGFDLDAPAGGPTPTDLLAGMTLKSWQDDKLDWKLIEKCREVGVKRFKDSVARVMAELDGMIADGRNVFFAHTMAGGIPKVKVFLAIANRIYKGRGER